LDPKAQNDLHVVETGTSHAKFTIHILFQNPTPYTLHVEYLHVHIYYDDTQIGEGWISDGEIEPRKQARALANITLHLTEQSKKAMISLLSHYICGKKAEVEIRLHEKSIPSMPHLSKILGGNFAVKVIMPRLFPDQSSDKVLETNNPTEKFVPEDGKVGSPDQGLESPVILAATMNVLFATIRLKLFNPLNVPIHVSKMTAQATHNTSHIGDLAAPDGWNWTLEPGVQETPDIPVTWSILSFGLDPMKGFSMLFDGWQRSGEVSVDVTAKATVQMGEMKLGEIETSIHGIATKVRV
jgi:LEA14-like dessication related protein